MDTASLWRLWRTLGAALYVNHMGFEIPRTVPSRDGQNASYLGPKYTDDEIELVIKNQNLKSQYFTNFVDRNSEVAKAVSEGKVVGYFSGRMEFGPRALGSRSILGDAQNSKMQSHMNLSIKYAKASGLLHQ